MFILDCLKTSINELADNPEKYPLKIFDEFKNDNQDFYFKKITTKTCKFFMNNK